MPKCAEAITIARGFGMVAGKAAQEIARRAVLDQDLGEPCETNSAGSMGDYLNRSSPRSGTQTMGKLQPGSTLADERMILIEEHGYSPATAGSGCALPARSFLSRSASRNASSIACSALSRGSQTVW